MKILKKLLLKKNDFKPSFANWKIEGVFNPAAIRMENKKIFLYARVAESSENHSSSALHCPIITSKEDYEAVDERVSKEQVVGHDRNVIYLKSGICRLTNLSHFRRIILSEDGLKIEEISKTPSFTGKPYDGEFGVEDPRIVQIGKKYYMTYVAISKREGISTALAESLDLEHWQRRGIIFREQNKDGVLFPEKINGMYVALNRPEIFYEFHRPAIWISYSPDLTFWGKEKSLLIPRDNSWEHERVGAGAPPIKLKEGWLLIYHGVIEIRKAQYYYSVGAALLDLKAPEKIIARTPFDSPLMKPTEKFEKVGYTNNVVFPTGNVIDKNKNLLIYYGAADSAVAVAKIAIKDILHSLEAVE